MASTGNSLKLLEMVSTPKELSTSKRLNFVAYSPWFELRDFVVDAAAVAVAVVAVVVAVTVTVAVTVSLKWQVRKKNRLNKRFFASPG